MVTSASKNSDKYAKLAALFRAGLTGDALSYNRFLQAISPIIHRAICKKLTAIEAEDVLQEILISIHKARHTYDGERPIMPWLLAITRFRINDALRKIYASPRCEHVDIGDLTDILVDVTETPSSNESLSELFKGVPEREQKILTMMHFEDYTAKETGQRLGMKESAVKVAAHRTMKKIRKAFGT